MLRWFLRNGSHAFQPLFKHKTDHSPLECSVCATRQRNQVNHIKPHVPLEYQQHSIKGTNITRFSLVINGDPLSAHGKTMSDLMMFGLECRFHRVLDANQKNTIPPTLANIESELSMIAQCLKSNDRLVIYNNTDVNIFELLYRYIPDKHVFVWLMDVNVATPFSTKTRLKLHVLWPKEKEEFTEKFIDMCTRHKNRVMIQSILPEFQFKTNYPYLPNKLYFGF